MDFENSSQQPKNNNVLHTRNPSCKGHIKNNTPFQNSAFIDCKAQERLNRFSKKKSQDEIFQKRSVAEDFQFNGRSVKSKSHNEGRVDKLESHQSRKYYRIIKHKIYRTSELDVKNPMFNDDTSFTDSSLKNKSDFIKNSFKIFSFRPKINLEDRNIRISKNLSFQVENKQIINNGSTLQQRLLLAKSSIEFSTRYNSESKGAFQEFVNDTILDVTIKDKNKTEQPLKISEAIALHMTENSEIELPNFRNRRSVPGCNANKAILDENHFLKNDNNNNDEKNTESFQVVKDQCLMNKIPRTIETVTQTLHHKNQNGIIGLTAFDTKRHNQNFSENNPFFKDQVSENIQKSGPKITSNNNNSNQQRLYRSTTFFDSSDSQRYSQCVNSCRKTLHKRSSSGNKDRNVKGGIDCSNQFLELDSKNVCCFQTLTQPQILPRDISDQERHLHSKSDYKNKNSFRSTGFTREHTVSKELLGVKNIFHPKKEVCGHNQNQLTNNSKSVLIKIENSNRAHCAQNSRQVNNDKVVPFHMLHKNVSDSNTFQKSHWTSIERDIKSQQFCPAQRRLQLHRSQNKFISLVP